MTQRDVYRIHSALRAAAFMFCLCITASLHAEGTQPAPTDKIAAFSRLLEDPQFRAWIADQAKEEPGRTTVAHTDPHRVHPGYQFSIAALQNLPREVGGVRDRLTAETQSAHILPVSVLLALVLAACVMAEWTARRFYRWTPGENGTWAMALDAAVPVTAFALCVALFYFSMDWPPLTGAVLAHVLATAVVGRAIFAALSVARKTGLLTAFMFRRVAVGLVVVTVMVACASVGVRLGITESVRRAVSSSLSLIVLAVAVETVWRRPRLPPADLRVRALLALALVGLWLAWALGFRLLFWLGIYAVALPPVLSAVAGVARAFTTARWGEDRMADLRSISIVYGARVAVLAAAVVWLTVVWNYSPNILARDNPVVASIIMGLLKSAMVLLLADFAWRVVAAMIDGHLGRVSGPEPLSPQESARRSRLRTLLPIFRNGLAAVMIVVTALTVLAEMGVQIGPLIAGAGVFGVALGFGSQTLVKDVISGVFYLMDDAFRVGEYIQSGSYKGTVESFSLRSVRLRHHRGPVFTVPFGELGAVQNMSRDWAIDKFKLTVDFKADVAKAKKLTKAVGAELLVDPELGPEIIETLKMKGVEQITELGIELSFAFTVRPTGHQSAVRRRAYVMLRNAFAENDIGFAQPTVQVGGDDGKSEAAAAAATLASRKAAARETQEAAAS